MPGGPGHGRLTTGEETMRNLLALIGLIVVGGTGLGWYLGWYQVEVQSGSEGQKRITIDFNTKKASGDARKFGETVAELVDDKVKRAETSKSEADSAAAPLLTPTTPPTPPTQTGGVTIQLPPIQIGGSK
jgi:hypothetical protein